MRRALCWGTCVPSDEIETFLALARKNLAIAYTKIALHSVTPTQEAQLWCLIHGVEAAMKIRALSLEDELEGIDRELESLFRPGGCQA
jgi:hypothetical protein